MAVAVKRQLESRAAVLADRNFRRFYIGYLTSMIGTSMAGIAVTFAVLADTGSAADVGYVMAARIASQVAFILGGGVLADRLGRRRVMLAADALRCCAQAALAIALFLGRPQEWLFVMLAVLVGAGEAFFGPALGALTTEIAPSGQLVSANALTGMASSVASVAGPALAGIGVAVAGPAVVVAADAASYTVSAIALGLLRLPGDAATARQWRPLRDLRDGWGVFRSCTWLWVTTVQFALFNLITWAPYLVLGPVLSVAYLGGARAWGTIMAAAGAGSIIGGLAALGRGPRRPLVVATVATFGYPVPCLLLALRLPLYSVAIGALAAGVGSALFVTFWMTTLQQQVRQQMLARADAFVTFGTFGLGAAGLAVAGPASAVFGAGRVLGAGAAWAMLSSIVVLALPAVRSVTWRPTRPDDTEGNQAHAR